MHLKGAVKNVHETFTSQFDFDIKTKIVVYFGMLESIQGQN